MCKIGQIFGATPTIVLISQFSTIFATQRVHSSMDLCPYLRVKVGVSQCNLSRGIHFLGEHRTPTPPDQFPLLMQLFSRVLFPFWRHISFRLYACKMVKIVTYLIFAIWVKCIMCIAIYFIQTVRKIIQDDIEWVQKSKNRLAAYKPYPGPDLPQVMSEHSPAAFFQKIWIYV